MAMLAFGATFKSIAATSTLTTDIGVKTPANQAITLDEVDVGFDGTNSANGPGIVDIDQTTFATNPPGTNSTSLTGIASDSGRPEAIQSLPGRTWTVQPTVLTVWKSFLVPVYMGSAIAPLPLMKALIAKGGAGVSLATTLPSAVTANVTPTLLCTE